MIVYKEYSFKNKTVDDICEALKQEHAVLIDGVWYFPINADYKESTDTIKFKLDQDLTAWL